MIKRCFVFALLAMVLCLNVASAQHPVLDMIANKVVQKYQQSSCDQLWKQTAQQQHAPKSPQEQEAIKILREDAQLRAEFLNKVAAPIANKMFECGLIP